MIAIPFWVNEAIKNQFDAGKTEQETLRFLLEAPKFSSYSHASLANYTALYYAKKETTHV